LAFTTLAPRYTYTVAEVVAEGPTPIRTHPYSHVRESLVGTVRWRCRPQAASPSSHCPRAAATYSIFECRQRHPPLSTVFAALHCTPRCHWNICSGLAQALSDRSLLLPSVLLSSPHSIALHAAIGRFALAWHEHYLIAHTRFCHHPWLVRNAADSLACTPRTAPTLGSSLLSLCTLPGA